MKDNETIKALECCGINQSCKGCPYHDVSFCQDEVNKDALDLINRQKAEIERLKEHIKHTNNVVKQVVEDTKAEAKKEFAERVKTRLHNEGGCDAEKETWAHGWDDAITRAIEIVDEELKGEEE